MSSWCLLEDCGPGHLCTYVRTAHTTHLLLCECLRECDHLRSNLVQARGQALGALEGEEAVVRIQ